jgi:hypothetical protein
MSLSIYYEVRRDRPITDEECALIQAAMRKYNENPEIVSIVDEGAGEMFSYYPETKEPGVILEGAVKLPTNLGSGRGDDLMFVADSWLELMCDIRKILKGSTWDASMDHHPIVWNEDKQRFDFQIKR